MLLLLTAVSNAAPPPPRLKAESLTDRDIEVAAFGLEPGTLTAGDVMAERPAVAEEDDDLLDALALMRGRGVGPGPMAGWRV